MADEKLKIKIIPEKYRHDIGEVEITIKESDIQLMGRLNAYVARLQSFLDIVKETGFHNAVQNNTNYKIINMVNGILWQNENEKEELLKQWLCESLEKEIIKYKTKADYTADYFNYLIDKGLIDTQKRVICYDLKIVGTTLSDDCKIPVTYETLKQFINPKTNKEYSKKMIEQVRDFVNTRK